MGGFWVLRAFMNYCAGMPGAELHTDRDDLAARNHSLRTRKRVKRPRPRGAWQKNTWSNYPIKDQLLQVPEGDLCHGERFNLVAADAAQPDCGQGADYACDKEVAAEIPGLGVIGLDKNCGNHRGYTRSKDS